jgi:hypothetical protein
MFCVADNNDIGGGHILTRMEQIHKHFSSIKSKVDDYLKVTSEINAKISNVHQALHEYSVVETETMKELIGKFNIMLESLRLQKEQVVFIFVSFGVL